MVAKHTPGPWRADGYSVYCVPTATCAGTHIARLEWRRDTRSDFRISGAEAVANARLIAAAPELLEALKAARDSMRSDYVTREEQGHVHKWKWGEKPTLSWVIEQAIAKAEGA